jgi:hypothetical protein
MKIIEALALNISINNAGLQEDMIKQVGLILKHGPYQQRIRESGLLAEMQKLRVCEAYSDSDSFSSMYSFLLSFF